ncbi:class I SAM-dependent methyltransferase [Magnetospirillum sulfuroxidans]|uniref:Methyltransferase domain-containing protein n=1 Tax=Magnetospirillum sulfuroxidans TaxID=611300 RepID=A0ABS5I9Q2_9PROT|nr:methyltransferase domain-containing protein [Magnetospirillum sulfuroxidans]MBR9970428.1 methyltransferase domain-containing protein [Magnetospirillum sulfuroxidans]
MIDIALIRHRRKVLRQHFDVVRQFEELEESCVPSYVHGNGAAAAISWWRLAAAARLYQKHAPGCAMLDFGAGTGEIHHLMHPKPVVYDFIEGNAILAGALTAFIPAAKIKILEEMEAGSYDAILALDSLEHNNDVAGLTASLFAALKPGGLFILSGPTENWLYRLGRRLAGFSGHYHTTTIADIEGHFRRHARLVDLASVPMPGLTLFRVSAWRKI